MTYLVHSAKGTTWEKKNHKYTKKENGIYYYVNKAKNKLGDFIVKDDSLSNKNINISNNIIKNKKSNNKNILGTLQKSSKSSSNKNVLGTLQKSNNNNKNISSGKLNKKKVNLIDKTKNIINKNYASLDNNKYVNAVRNRKLSSFK